MSAADTIVVGVDGSPGSQHAVRWAAEEARLRKARLRAVFAWESPVQVIGGSGWLVPDTEMIEEYAGLMQQRLDEALEPLADELAGIEVERVAIHGPPASVLIEAAREAIQLVVGTRGHGGFVGLLLGSVSQQCSSHAPCPVVIVPR
ncbi:MAG: universal stress protein [Gaiellaceae bacterium]